ncbi:MarR family transcriptional regulator, partial [Actinosynnema sp.]|uniref:MarR family transcriptional regulator n=1 Tax=Actinosynnema sp. TaxID=1872144 RepID=UPI003F82CF2F
MAPTPVNRSRLLALLRDEGPLSRVALGERLGVPRAALSAELGRLAEAGLVEEGGPAASRGGRRSVLVRLAAELRVLAVAVGATSVTVAVADGRCEVLARVTEESDVRDGPGVVLERVVRLAARVRELAPGRVVAAGVGLPGPESFRDGVPVAPPIMPG